MSYASSMGTSSVGSLQAALDKYLPCEQQRGGESIISDVQTYRKVRSDIVDVFESGRILTKEDFDKIYYDLRNTQEYARQVSLPEKHKLQVYDNSQIDLEACWKSLLLKGLIAADDDDLLIKVMMYRQYLRLQPGFTPPSFTDVRQWIGMIYLTTLKNMAEETAMYKNSKPRTRSELFLRLYLLGKISGVQLEFHHTDFRS